MAPGRSPVTGTGVEGIDTTGGGDGGPGDTPK